MEEHDHNWTSKSDTEYDTFEDGRYKRDVTWEACTFSGCRDIQNVRRGNWEKI